VAAAALSLVGCGKPMKTITYYAPSGPNLRVESSDGPANEAIVELPDPDVRLMVIAQPSYDPARIWVSVHLPEGKTLRVVGNQFTLTSQAGSKVRTEKVNRIQGTYIVDGEGIYKFFQVGDDLPGASTPTITRFWGKHITQPRQFEITALLGSDLPAAFNLTLPEQQLNGKTLHIAPIAFTREQGKVELTTEKNHSPW
jgi:hypothetical protein